MSAPLPEFDAPRLIEYVCGWCRCVLVAERPTALCPRCEEEYERQQELDDSDPYDWREP